MGAVVSVLVGIIVATAGYIFKIVCDRREEKEKISLLRNKIQRIGNQFLFTLNLKTSVRLPPQLLLELRSNNYFEGSTISIPGNHIEPFASEATELELRADLKEGSDCKFQKKCIFRLKDSCSKWFHEYPFNLRVYDYIGDLDPKLNLNILLFGWCGIGKSSFVNTAQVTLDAKADNFVGQALVGSTNMHTTVRFSEYKLQENANIMLWDTKGLQYNEYCNSKLAEILAGNCPSGSKLSDKLEPGEVKSLPVKRMHTVLIFVAADILQEGGDKIREYRRIIRQFGDIYHFPSPLIVLTNVDKLPEMKGKSWSREIDFESVVEKNLVLQKIRTKASKELGGDENSVFFLFNYGPFGENRKRSFEIERYCWHILKAAIDAGRKSKKLMEEDFSKQ